MRTKSPRAALSSRFFSPFREKRGIFDDDDERPGPAASPSVLRARAAKKFNDDRGDCTSIARNFTLKRFGEVRRESEVPDNVSLSGQ